MRFSGGIDAASSNRKRRMRKQSLRTIIAGGAGGSLVLTLLGPLGGAAAFPVVDGNEDDIGRYTDGSWDSMEIGDPTYRNADDAADKLAHGMSYPADNVYKKIFDDDRAPRAGE